MNDRLLILYIAACAYLRRAWARMSTTLLRASLMLGTGLMGTITSAQAQDRPGGSFGGDEDYWSSGDTTEGLFSPETTSDAVGGGGSIMGELCWGITLFQKLALFACIVAMFYWAFQAARGSGQSRKWKLAGLALLVAAFVGDPVAWLNLFGIDLWSSSTDLVFGLGSVSENPWACLSGGPGYDFF